MERCAMKDSEEGDIMPSSEEKLYFDDNTLTAIAEVYKNDGNEAYKKKEFSNAIHFYTEGIKVNCRDEEMNAKLHSNRATAHFHQGDYQESLNDARDAVELQPNYIKAIARGASACVELGLYEEAITWCDKGLTFNKNNKTLLELRNKSVVERNKLKKTKRAKMKTGPEKYTAKGKQCGKSIKNRTEEEGGCTGIAYRTPEDLKKAKDYHKHCLKLAKRLGDRFNEQREYCNLGNVYSAMGNLKKAIDYHEHSLKIAKEMRDRCNEGRAYCNLGYTFKDLGDFKRAVEFLEISLKIAIEVKDSIEEARACHNLGITHRRLKDFTKAINYYERCLKISKEAEDMTGEGHTHGNIGNVYFELGNFEKAIECHECGLNLAKEVGDRYGEGRTYGNLGASYNSLGHFEKAAGYLESCVKITKELEDRFAEGDACRDLGNTYCDLEDFKKAIYFHERCLKIAKEDENKSTEAGAYGNLGAVYTRSKDFKKAIDHFESGLKIAKEVKDRSQEGRAYCNLGIAYQSLGNLNKAIYYHELHLKISKEEGDRCEEGKACGDLGTAYIGREDLKKAVDYVKLSLQIAIEVKDSGEEVRAYNHLGIIYDRLGDFMKAKICHEKSLKISKEVKDRSGEKSAYGNLGNAYLSLGDLKKAIECFELFLQISKEVEDRSAEGHAYGDLGNAYGTLGDYKKAIYYHERFLQISKELGDRYAETCACIGLGNTFCKIQDHNKAIEYNELSLKLAIEVTDRRGQGIAYCNLGSDYYHFGDFKKAIKYHELALKIATEVKDRSAEGRAYGNIGLCHFRLGDYERGIDYQRRNLQIAKEVDEVEEEAYAYERLGGSLECLGFLHEALDCYKSSVKAFNAMRARLQSKDEWKVSFRDKQLAIETYTHLCSVLLRLDRPVEALCAAENGRAQALNDLMVARYGIRRTDKRSSTDEETIQDILRGIPCEAIFPAFFKSAIHFWVIQNGKDVYSREEEVSCLSTWDEAVSYVQKLVETTLEDVGVRSGMNCEDRSLDTLRNPYSAEQNSNQNRSHSLKSQNHHLRNLYDVIIAPIADLIHGDEIIIVPEGPLWLAPFVAALMDSNSKFLCESFRIRVIPSLTSLRLILDSPEDYHSKTGALLVGDPWVQEVINDQGQKLDQLPYARREVEMIGRILNTAPLTGKEATKNEVALVHIAAHGRMETGEIALCPNQSRASQVPKDEDFLLTMSDVMNVKLTARLVVLSCCHSGRGEIKAEGVVGIARAFLGAGARSVLVSLWAIDDEATLEFMKNFYQHLVEGKSASEALNRAMKCTRESERFSEVKYWAPFVLVGDDVTLEFAGSD